MAVISPVSDLRHYNTVLEQVSAGSPVYLTVNGRGKYTIRDIHDDEAFEKANAMLRLMCALNAGKDSGEKEGYLSDKEVRDYFRRKK
ncbi:MAG: hypothetical protein IJ187_10850 [Neisseriaceae bacterium]|nr:hypothetical protein [Neisseriaceae bacterium]MBQ9724193.1 hypothetical protein [Neisseriaceae bacterium]